MRGLDTNVLLRYLTADDATQAARVEALFAAAERNGERLFLSVIALCELSWTLRGGPYRADREQIAAVLERVLATALFEVQDRTLGRRALADYRAGGADFADYLLDWLGREAGCTDTVTFDRKLSGTDGFAQVP
ncbi:MAG TPA: type II toxin-antitoxin system VapC family toxin [Thermoanaerobaculia bacterium]